MQTLITIVACVLLVLGVTSVARRLSWSAPLLLLLVGAAVSYFPFSSFAFIPFDTIPVLEPELILVGFLPPLLYATAVNTSLLDFKTHLAPIGWLSIGAVIFTMIGIGFLISWMLPVPLAAAFALGAVVAPPDAVSATAVARKIGLPRRIVTILEGESLVNDATALVSLRTAIAAMVVTVTLKEMVTDFILAVVIGIVAGVFTARVIIFIFKHIKHTATVTALTFLAPFIAFALSESFHASGVIGVVAAGLILGHVTPIVKSSEARLSTWMNWGTVQYVLEHSVFLMVGLQTKTILVEAATYPMSNWQIAWMSLVVLAAVVILRIIWMTASRFFLYVRKRRPAWGETLIISWAGMRGVVTLAGALSLPLLTPYRPILILFAMVVTAGTLILYGLTLPWVSRRLGLRGPNPREDALQAAMITQRAVDAGLAEIERVREPGDEDACSMIRRQSEERLGAIWARVGQHTPEGEGFSETPDAKYRRLRFAGLAAERLEVLRMRDEGLADNEVLQSVLAALDLEESRLVRREISERQAVNALPAGHLGGGCIHLEEANEETMPSTNCCAACLVEDLTPVSLRMCLTCGHVACSDESEGAHAALHFRITGHPVMRSLEAGQSWRWCYIDNLYGEED